MRIWWTTRTSGACVRLPRHATHNMGCAMHWRPIGLASSCSAARWGTVPCTRAPRPLVLMTAGMRGPSGPRAWPTGPSRSTSRTPSARRCARTSSSRASARTCCTKCVALPCAKLQHGSTQGCLLGCSTQAHHDAGYAHVHACAHARRWWAACTACASPRGPPCCSRARCPSPTTACTSWSRARPRWSSVAPSTSRARGRCVRGWGQWAAWLPQCPGSGWLPYATSMPGGPRRARTWWAATWP